MKLGEYRRKRKFTRTPEPEGGKKRGRKPGPLRFVVQKHAASHIHFDFRIEIGGVFKSWAIPRGPSLNPLNQRLAVFVEDHPLEYGAFEGVIPKGNYGAGTVMIWDHGVYEERSSATRAASEKTLAKGLAAGKLTFILHGSKLNGEFALVQLKDRDPKHWLLLKKRDSFARFRDEELDDRSATSGRTMPEIAEQSTTKRSIWISQPVHAAAVVEPPSPRRFRVMQARITTQFTADDTYLYEPHLKGQRVIAEIEKKRVKLYSRGWLPLEKKYPAVVKALVAFGRNSVLDGEILGAGAKARLLISDILQLDGKDLRPKPLSLRKARLKSLTLPEGLGLIPGSPSLEQALVEAEKAKALFLVAKKKKSPYHGGVSADWLQVSRTRLRQQTQAGDRRPTPVALPVRDEPRLLNLGKIFWPKEGITKGNLIEYYRRIAPVLLPHLRDRPESLHRQPDGLKNDGFFQKDMEGYLPRRISTVRIYSASAAKTINYLLCQDEWTLLYLINLGCIELNPWLSRKAHLDRPDFVVIDLDPDGNPFPEVIEAAREIKRLLDSLGVESWCKTSGATGLHICVPTGARIDFDSSRQFAEVVCRIAHTRLGGFTSVERTPARRRGKIYLDFLQNRRGQTLAAPYCVRPRPGATVSTPLRWSEVKRGLDPSNFTIQTIERRIARLGDLWRPLLGKGQDLALPMKKLIKLLHNR